MNPLCFVLMPFGRKPDEQGRFIDFDAVYRDMIAPAVRQARLDPIRADEEQVGGSIHKPMFERLMLCEYAIADLTTANPNVYYELGIRHALRPRSTVILFCEGTKLPFDVALLRGMPYRINEKGLPREPKQHAASIGNRLKQLRKSPAYDSPVFQMIEGLPVGKVDHEKTDIFREHAEYSKKFKSRLETARSQGAAAVRAVAADPELNDFAEVETGILVDLFLSYRDVKAHQEMLDLYERMPEPLQRTRMVQEQRAFALNRLGRRDDAERVLRQLIASHGPSSETNGLLGRVCKDRWEDAVTAGERLRAAGELDKAIEAYVTGFEADWRDPYPGINAVTLMELADQSDPRRSEILPVVLYAALRRARSATSDYWDHATLTEAAVLARDAGAAKRAAAAALAKARAGWEVETTARNLGLIRKQRVGKGEDVAWLTDLLSELDAAAGKLTKDDEDRKKAPGKKARAKAVKAR